MPLAAADDSALYRIEREADTSVLRLSGDWGRAHRLPTSEALATALTRDGAACVVIDGGELTSAHPRVAAVVHALQQRLARRDVDTRTRHLPESIHSLMTLARPAPATGSTRRGPRWITRFGALGRGQFDAVLLVARLVGNAAAATPRLALGRAQARWPDFVALVRETGAASLPVVTVVNLLIGAVLGFVGAVQLNAFGAGLYLADLVGIAVAREMAAIMTAFIMAGRVGATFAAHLATMEANEEIDALRMIGVAPFEYLVLPRLAALTLMMPLLFLYAATLGIIGGMAVGDLVLNTSPMSFLGRLEDAVAARHFVIGFVKAVCFGVLIALASCHMGMRAGRNAAEVGRAATRTVVVSIIGIIVIDAIFALCTNALGV